MNIYRLLKSFIDIYISCSFASNKRQNVYTSWAKMLLWQRSQETVYGRLKLKILTEKM